MTNEQDKPDWEKGDTTKSLRDIIAIGRLALAEFINKLSEVNNERN